MSEYKEDTACFKTMSLSGSPIEPEKPAEPIMWTDEGVTYVKTDDGSWVRQDGAGYRVVLDKVHADAFKEEPTTWTCPSTGTYTFSIEYGKFIGKKINGGKSITVTGDDPKPRADFRPPPSITDQIEHDRRMDDIDRITRDEPGKVVSVDWGKNETTYTYANGDKLVMKVDPTSGKWEKV